jgi:hypothetical protein
MDADRSVAVRTAYEARPGRRAIVVLDLADLHGPVDGVIELPLRLFWSSSDHTFDLGDPNMLREVYETVLREASRPEDLTSHLNYRTLVAVWQQLHLPRGVRRAWQEQHPVLRESADSAA